MTNCRSSCQIVPTNRYRRQLQKLAKSGQFTKRDLQELNEVIDRLAHRQKLAVKYRDHQLTNPFSWGPGVSLST